MNVFNNCFNNHLFNPIKVNDTCNVSNSNQFINKQLDIRDVVLNNGVLTCNER